MFRVRILLAAVLAVSALAILAVPASAAVPAKNTKFCNASLKIGSLGSASAFTQAKAKKLVSQFKTAAKYAPAKVKSAIGKITKLVGTIAGTSNPGDLTKLYASDAYKGFPAAITTYSTYEATACTGT
jgi:hypothetical protein